MHAILLAIQSIFTNFMLCIPPHTHTRLTALFRDYPGELKNCIPLDTKQATLKTFFTARISWLGTEETEPKTTKVNTDQNSLS